MDSAMLVRQRKTAVLPSFVKLIKKCAKSKLRAIVFCDFLDSFVLCPGQLGFEWCPRLASLFNQFNGGIWGIFCKEELYLFSTIYRKDIRARANIKYMCQVKCKQRAISLNDGH